jgi:acyl dehydratase
MAPMYYEDLAVGYTDEFGGRTVTRSEIIEFASHYDPQPFHVNEEAASESVFDGLVASGIHTVALCNRMTVDHFFQDTAVAGGPGIEEVSLPRPVEPGDTLSVRIEISEKKPLESRPGKGLVKLHQMGLNNHDEIVLEMTSLPFISRREA